MSIEKSPRGLASKLDAKQYQQFLRRAVPELKQDCEHLLELLQTQQWTESTHAAHKLLSVCKLLELDALLPLLQRIHHDRGQSGIADVAQWQPLYQAELAALEATLCNGQVN
jgi:HPt (histidine-containing phosphotransfer) domain-containing protein